MRLRRYIPLFLAVSLFAADKGLPKLKPGFNLYSKKQDVELGRAAAEQVSQKYQEVKDPTLDAYLQRIGRKLAAQPQADSADFPYTFTLVYDKSINAFALPGGPTFVHTGLIAAADNEAQVAGVLAHEISHVALRHGTHEASKSMGIQIIAGLAGSAVGGRGMLGQLSQAGIAFGANSVLLKYSRDAERQADLLGGQIMAGAGYNPLEMARFFEKLEAEGGGRGPQFLSDHPNPGNRIKAIEEEIRYLPRSSYTTGDAGQFAQIKERVRLLKGYAEPRAESSNLRSNPSNSRPTGQFREYQGREFSFEYPDNWRVSVDQNSGTVTAAAPDAVLRSAVGYGVIGSFVKVPGQVDLKQGTRQLIDQMQKSNPGLRVSQSGQRLVIDEQDALVTTCTSDSAYQGQTEVDLLVTVARPKGLFYLIMIAPDSEFSAARPAFDHMINSIRFAR